MALRTRSTPSADACDRCAPRGRKSRRGRSRARRFRPEDPHGPGERFRPRRAGIQSSSWCSCRAILEHAAAHLVGLDAFEQGAEIAFAEALVALALNDFEEDGADGVLGEDLQQQALILGWRAVHQDAVALEAGDVFAMALDAIVKPLVIGVRRALEWNAARRQYPHRHVDIVSAERNVLDARALIDVQMLPDLRFVVGGFVERNANLAVRAGHGAGLEAGQLALDVEIANLAEIEEPLVEAGPLVHVAAKDIVRHVIDIGDAGAFVDEAGDRIARHEIDVIDRALAVAVDQIDHAAADAFDGGDVQLHRAHLVLERLGAETDQLVVGGGGILDAKGHGAGAGPVGLGETRAVALRLRIDDEVGLALAIERHRLGAMPANRAKSHLFEQGVELVNVRRGVLDELEAVGADGIVPELRHAVLLQAGIRING